MIVSIDIGGTNLVCCLIDERDKVSDKEKIKTEPQKGGDYIASNIIDYVSRKSKYTQIVGIAISASGQISNEGTIVSATNTFKNWIGYPLKKVLEDKLKINVTIINDVQSMALGETDLLTSNGFNIAIALGTGVGGAIINDGQLLRGDSGAAGELGHLVLYPNGNKCSCGNNGCSEAYLSATAIQQIYQEQYGYRLSAKNIFESESADALKVKEEYLNDLVCFLTSVTNIFSPNNIIIGGGVSKGLLDSIQFIAEEVRGKVLKVNENVNIMISLRNDDAMLIGAAHYFRSCYSNIK